MSNTVTRSPETWTRLEANVWLRERVREYGLDPELPNRFPMNGKGLCMLDKEDFRQRAPHTGDVLYNSLRCLALATSPLKQQSLAHGASSYRAPESHENFEASLAFCAGHFESSQQPQLLPARFDRRGLELPENEPLNLKVTKLSPPPPVSRTFERSRSYCVESFNDEGKSVGFDTTARHWDFNNNNSNYINNNYIDNYSLNSVESIRPAGPVRFLPSLLPPQRPSATSSSSSSSPHLCPSSPEQVPGTRSAPSSSPIGAGPHQVPRCPQLTSRDVRFSPHLTSLASLSSAAKSDVIDVASSAMTSVPNYPTPMHVLEEIHKSFTSEADLQPIQVSTTTDTATSTQRHRKMDLNLSTSDRLLWKFLAELLERNRTKCVAWEDRQRLTFQIVDPNELAELWGEEKCRPGMTYEKLSRALRYYYKLNILEKVPGKRLTYKFVTSPQFIKKGKRGAKPGVPHKRRTICSKPPPPPSNVSTEDCSEQPTSFYVSCDYSTYFGSE